MIIIIIIIFKVKYQYRGYYCLFSGDNSINNTPSRLSACAFVREPEDALCSPSASVDLDQFVDSDGDLEVTRFNHEHCPPPKRLKQGNATITGPLKQCESEVSDDPEGRGSQVVSSLISDSKTLQLYRSPAQQQK